MLRLFVVVVSIFFVSGAHANQSLNDYRCKNINQMSQDDDYVRFLKADYVSVMSLSIMDVNNYDSPDSRKLGVYRGMDFGANGQIIWKDGNVDFENLKKFILTNIAKGLPYYDVELGQGARRDKFIEDSGLNYIDNVTKLQTQFDKSEKLRNQALYGFNPLQVRCTVTVKGTRYPIILHERCLVEVVDGMPNWYKAVEDSYVASPENVKDVILANTKRMIKDSAAVDFLHAQTCKQQLE